MRQVGCSAARSSRATIAAVDKSTRASHTESRTAPRAQASIHQRTINPIIYAEISLSFSTLEGLDRAISTLALELRDVPRPALFLAAKAFLQYRRRGGSTSQVVPDFFIGAHATVAGWPLLTRDARRFNTYFPSLDVIAP